MSSPTELAPEAPPALGISSSSRSLARTPAAVVPIAFLGVLTVACIAAPLIAPYNPQAQDLSHALSGPTAQHLLGTDELGRDVLSRLLYGGRRSLLSVLEGVAIVTVLGVPAGLIAGYVGGGTDRVVSRAAEIAMAVPAIIIVLVVLAVLPNNEDAAMVAFGVLGVPVMLRVVRSATLHVRGDLYIDAARLSGLSHPRIVVRHVLPLVTGAVVVQASLFAAYALLFETGLGFLGLTGGATAPTWGGMVGEGSTVLLQQKWLIFPPGILIALVILAFGVLGDAVRDKAMRNDGSNPAQLVGLARPHRPRHVVEEPARPGLTLAFPLLEVRGLSVVLLQRGRSVLVVDSVDLTVATGETVGLVGESGCGKTVTALAILRLLRDPLAVSGGSVLLQGQDLLLMSDRRFDRLRGSEIGFVSQDPQASLDPAFSVGSQLREVIRRHDPMSRRAAGERACDLLRMVEFPDPTRVSRLHPHELSGGMAQRAALALALAGNPLLLIADEPTTALDVTVQAEILALLRKLQADSGMALLLITHNWGVVSEICDRTIVMYAGQVIEEAMSDTLLNQPLHPYTVGLIQSHPSHARAGSEFGALSGSVPAPGSWPPACRFAPRCGLATPECTAGPIEMVRVDGHRLARCVRAASLEVELGRPAAEAGR